MKDVKLKSAPVLKITPYLKSVIQKVSKEKESVQSPVFKNYKDAATWLDSFKQYK